MNDPHIEALHYIVKHAEDVDYDNAPPRTRDTPGFGMRVPVERDHGFRWKMITQSGGT
jgi:hypothetical protein